MICESAEANFWAMTESNEMKDEIEIEIPDGNRDDTLEHVEESM